jgi:cytochrome oxidase Cu insertion factor (SCO1/SenC/PrrC family)
MPADFMHSVSAVMRRPSLSTSAIVVGCEAPPLVLPDEGGRQVDLQDYRGQPVLVSFLSHAA